MKPLKTEARYLAEAIATNKSPHLYAVFSAKWIPLGRKRPIGSNSFSHLEGFSSGDEDSHRAEMTTRIDSIRFDIIKIR